MYCLQEQVLLKRHYLLLCAERMEDTHKIKWPLSRFSSLKQACPLTPSHAYYNHKGQKHWWALKINY